MNHSDSKLTLVARPSSGINLDERTVNYLHCGDSLAQGRELDLSGLSGAHQKHVLIGRITGQDQNWLADVIRGYGPKQAKKINVEEFKSDFRRSLRARSQFRALGCRGFSHWIDEDAQFCDYLREEINLRIALMAGEDLFYPARIKQYLRRVNNNHSFRDGFPSIAFGLGIRTPQAWYVFILQSDLAIRTPAYMREHFRGWRKVLFSNILSLASQRVPRVFLCRVEDVLRACNPSLPAPRVPPTSWKAIYDRTAADFGMRLVRLPKPIGIQIFPNQEPVLANEFFEATLV